jgi:HEAT repeat protein
MLKFVWHALLCLSMLTCTAVACAQDDLIPLITELLKDADPQIRGLAFEQVRTEAPGPEATKKFAELLPTMPAATQVGLVNALSARGDAAAAPAIRTLLAESKDEPVRVAAINALGFIGADADAAVLAKMLKSDQEAERAAARAALVRIPGEDPSKAIVAEMLKAKADDRVALIEILTERRAGEAELLEAAVGDDAETRKAAMGALGAFATPERLPKLLRAVLKAERGDERTAAERAVADICVRSPETAPAQLVNAYEACDPQEQLVLLSTLGRVGGPEALKVVEAAYASKDSAQHSAGLAALCNWPSGVIAPRLLELARTEEHPEHRTQARKALIRVAPLSDTRTDAQRLDLLRTTLLMCDGDKERNQVIDRAKAIRTIESLRFVLPFLEDDEFRQQACLTIVELAHHNKLRVPNKEEFDRALDQAIALSKDPGVIDRAQRYKKGQTWVRPKAGK